MSDTIYDDLPDNDELAFLKLESAFREQCDNNAFQIEQNEERGYVAADVYIRYMRQTSAAAAELGLGIANELFVPSATGFAIGDYRDFVGKIDHYRTALQIRHARRSKGYSVKFDAKTKLVIAHHLAQIREIIIVLEVDDWKKESLLNCLNNLQIEVDKDRSGYEVLGAFVIESAGILGEAAEKLEPIRKIIDSVAGLVWGTKHAEQTPRLSAPSTPKQIPAPKTKPLKDFDDEIPF